ncbi:hypothetical protein GC194_07720 [bacterium]|nr:hypothetical protein [bacterium]
MKAYFKRLPKIILKALIASILFFIILKLSNIVIFRNDINDKQIIDLEDGYYYCRHSVGGEGSYVDLLGYDLDLYEERLLRKDKLIGKIRVTTDDVNEPIDLAFIKSSNGDYSVKFSDNKGFKVDTILGVDYFFLALVKK